MSFFRNLGSSLGRSKGSNDSRKDKRPASSSSPTPLNNAHRPPSPALAVVQPAPAPVSIPEIVPTPPPSQPTDEDVEMQDGTIPSPTPPPAHNRTASLSVPSAQRPPLDASGKRSSIITSGSRSRSPSIVLENDGLNANCALSLPTIIAEIAPIPCICTVIQGLTVVFQAIEKSKANREQWRLLRGRCVMVVRMAGTQVLNFGGEHYPGLVDASSTLQQAITWIAGRANHWNQKNEIEAFMRYQEISQEIKGHFSTLDACLKLFSYATDVAQMQWIGEFNAVQQKEFDELEKMRKALQDTEQEMRRMAGAQDGLVTTTTEIHEMMKMMMNEKFQILQNRTTTPVEIYDDAKLMVQMLRTVADIQLPPHLLLGKQCIPDTSVPIRTGVTCDIFSASFLSDEKVAKKVFRIGMSDEEHVSRYAERFMRDAKLWSTFRCDYTLPFYGIGMEAFEGNKHFQLYMVSPLVKNFDAMTYLKKHKNNPGMKEGILRIITDAAKGLQYLHNRNPPVVHSGMRGENVLVTESGGGVLGGFGLTKALQNTTGPEKTPPAVMTGKTEGQRWMSPEMFLDDNPALHPPLDVWSWGMTALEIISGKIPYYHNKQTHTIIMDIRFGKTPQRAKYPDFEKYALKPDEMWALLEKCWAIEPEDRPTIDEVLIALKKMAN